MKHIRKTSVHSMAMYLTAAALSYTVTAEAQNDPKRPNVLFLAVDDWNDHLEGYFNKQAVTPNLNKLMERGVSFTNNHTAASFSTPSRTALMTGVAPWVSGCYQNQPHLYNMPERTTIDELFKENGYATYGGGKVYHHMSGYVNLDGFDEYFHWLPELKKTGWRYDAWNKKNKATPESKKSSNKDLFILPNEMESEMADTKTTDWAVNTLKKEHNKPFFLAVGMYAPHQPNYVPEKYFDMHPLQDIILPNELIPKAEDNIADYEDWKDLSPALQKAYSGRTKRIRRFENGEADWKKFIQGYLAACSYSDAQLGKVLDALYDSPYADNTIIVFWSDNGYHLGEKCVFAKHTLWERTTNVPLIISTPKGAKNVEYKGVTSLLDIFPTLIEECDLKLDQPMDGESLSDELRNPQIVVDRAVLTTNRDYSYSVFTNKWHYNSHVFGDGSKAEELYDAQNDNKEHHNLVENPKYSDVVATLRMEIPKNPASPAALGGPSGTIELVCEGESFKWVEKSSLSK